MTRRGWAEALLAAAVLVGVPVVIAVATGGWVIPHNDAWAHAVIAQTWAETGQIELVGWNRPALLGQVLLLGPLGASVGVQHVFVALCGFVALIMTYLLVLPRAGESGGLLALAALGVTPEFGLLTTSYMSDVPALAGMLTCLWAADKAIRDGSIGLWWLAVVAGAWAVTVREQALVAPVAALTAAWLARRPGRALVAVSGAALAAALGAFEWWRRSLPADDPPGFEGLDARSVVTVSVQILMTLGLFLVPVVLAAAHPHRWRPRWVWVGIGAGAVTVALAIVAVGRRALLGNYVGPGVAYPVASVEAPALVPPGVWTVVVVAVAVAAALLVGQVWHERLPRDPLLLCAGALLLLGTLAQAALGHHVLSRYLLALIPIGAGLLLAGRTDLAKRVAWAVAGLLFAWGCALTVATQSYDIARWAAAERLVAAGAPARDIDAGLEWVGTHAAEPFDWGLARGGTDSWYVSGFASSRSCHIVSGGPLAGRQPAEVVTFPTFGVDALLASRLYVYSGGC